MRKMITSATIVVVLSIGTMALAQDAKDIVAELELRGYSVALGVEVDINELEEVAAKFPTVYLVVLVEDPAGGNDLLATEIADAVGGTVIVVSPNELGARSAQYFDEDLGRAFDASEDAFFEGRYTEGYQAFASALVLPVIDSTTTASTAATAATAATEADVEPAQKSRAGLYFLLFIVGVVGLIVWGVRRSNRSRTDMREDRVDEIKAEIQAQLAEAANDILELEDDVLLSDNEAAKELYYAGSAGYAEFGDRLASATSFAELDEMAEGADYALWQLESAEALLDGKKPPPKPDARATFEPPKPLPPERRHPELPDDLQLRRERQSARLSRPRQRSSAGIGGLGAAAVILKAVQARPRPTSTQRSTSRPAAKTTKVSRSSRTKPTKKEAPPLRGRSRRRKG